jgi:hypothetical protein
MVRGRRTTITVGELLSEFLLTKLGKSSARFGGKSGRKAVGEWIRTMIDREPNQVPLKDVSQWVQERILREIVNPDLAQKLLERLQAGAVPISSDDDIWMAMGIAK